MTGRDTPRYGAMVQFGHRHQRLDPASGWETRISADIGHDVGGKRDELAIGVEGAVQFDALLAAMKRRDQILAAILAPSHAAAQFARQPNQHDIFGGERHFLSEGAADIRRHHAQFGFGKAENVGNSGAREMRHLRGAGQCRAARACVERRMRGARFERRGVLPVGLHSEANSPRRLSQDGGEIRGLKLAVDHDISHLMHGRRVRRQCVAHVANGRQFLDLDLDAIRRIFGLRRCRREHSGDRFADETHHVIRQDWLLDREIIVFVQHRPDRPRR